MLPRFELTTLVLFDAGAVIQVWEEAAKFGAKRWLLPIPIFDAKGIAQASSRTALIWDYLSKESAENLELVVGKSAYAIIKASNVIVGID